MREKPILFGDELVRAIVVDRKTQTRRLLRLPAQLRPDDVRLARMQGGYPDGTRPIWDDGDNPNAFSTHNPFGAPGDRLYVREAWSRTCDEYGCEHIAYRADGMSYLVGAKEDGSEYLLRNGVQPKPVAPERWRPSIHMPRWASRLALEVTGVRVERLHDIGEADARAEGFQPITFSTDGRGTDVTATARERFIATWEAIYGAAAQASNPWVWVVSFRRLP